MARPLNQFFGGIQIEIGAGMVSGGIGNPDSHGPRFFAVSGSPEGSVSGWIGDIAINTMGGAANTLFVKESGNGTLVGWIGK